MDTTRQPLALILTQFILLLGVFWWRFSLYPLPCEVADILAAAGEGSVTGFNGGWCLLPAMWIGRFAASHTIAAGVISSLLVFSNAFHITRIMSRNLVFTARSYLPGIFYLLASCGIFFGAADLSSVLAATLLIRACSAFIASFVRADSFHISFRGAFVLGLTPLLHPYAALLLLLVPVAMTVFRRTVREGVVAFVGALLPSLAWAYLVWATDGEFSAPYIAMWNGVTTGAGIIGGTSPADIARYAAAGFFAVMVLLSVFSYLASSGDMRTRAVRINTFMVWFLVIAAGAFALPGAGAGDMTVIAIPVAFILPAFFIRQKGRVSAICYALLIATITAANLLPFIF